MPGQTALRRNAFAGLLILLLASTGLDEAWAAATPDPADDELAAQNNEYVYSPPQHLRDRFHPTGTPAGGDANCRDFRPCDPTPARGALPPVVPGARFGPDLLYTLMSLRW